MSYGLEDRGSIPGREKRFSFFFTASRSALRPIQPPIQWVQGTHSLGVKRPGREADHSPPSNAEGQEKVDLYIHSPTRLHDVVLNSLRTGTLPFTGFESLPGNWIRWLRYFMNFLSLLRYIPRQCLKLYHEPFPSTSLTFHYSLIIQPLDAIQSLLLTTSLNDLNRIVSNRIGEMLDSCFGWDTGYPHWGFSSYPPPPKIVPSASFPIFPVHNHATIPHWGMWLRHYATIRRVAGSIPGEFIRFFNWPNPFSRTMALGSNQPLTKMSTRNLPGGKGMAE
jgi:hypothetical protein